MSDCSSCLNCVVFFMGVRVRVGVLPTNGSARFGQALTVADFTKHVHVVTASETGLRAITPTVVALAEAEGLPAHADSVRWRSEP